ncbi:sensor signal transduction histidine kinase [Candidatus Magnetobacterium bavaricum]|uniref:histidine kinase n=1 Tax=Candidatus Magnetobacterium bavaricum TaxID=29290 RepID=A0A0F3GMN9_9BACT|nr:sensor signal transduction histidine kinase [Candidatus Magnetobacterium bavaricum]
MGSSEKPGHSIFFDKLSLTVKIATIMVILGVVLLIVLSTINGKMMSEIFNAQLQKQLESQNRENGQMFDAYFLSYQHSVGALANTYDLITYVKKASWDGVKPTRTDNEHEIPQWLPKASILKFYAGFDYAMLYDVEGRLREVYNATGEPLPSEFMDLAQLRLYPGQSYMKRFGIAGYVLASKDVKDADGNNMAALVIAHRINDDLLIDAMGPLSVENTLVLADAKDHTIMATNKPDLMPKLKTVESLRDKFIFGGKRFLDYGEDEVHLMLVSLIPIDEVKELRANVLSGSLRFNVINAVALILSFIVIMLYITMRIRRLDSYVATVSVQRLGLTTTESKGGDQLRILERRFHRLFDEIIESKSLLEKRASDMERINVELKETTGQLVQSAKLSALGELTAGIAHELNQPLNGIKIVCQSVIKDIQKNRHNVDELETDLTDIVEQVDKMAAIIDHMRIFTRRTEGMNTQLIDINTVVEGPFKLLGQQLKINGINVIKELTPELPLFRGDIIRLEQVFINLINNAKNALKNDQNTDQYANQDTDNTLTIRTYLTHDSGLPSCPTAIVAEVQDNGPGIPESIRDKIFQPFFTTNDPGKGTGLGLSVSKKIIDEHGGKISVQSDIGKATIFTVVLPVTDDKP